jgi:hypothetical protein
MGTSVKRLRRSSEGEALWRQRRGRWIMHQGTMLNSGSRSSSNIQELPNPETNPRRNEMTL